MSPTRTRPNHFNADRQLDYVEIGNRIIDWKYNEDPAPGTGRIESVELPGTEGEIFFTFDPQQHYVSDLVGPATQRVTMSRNGGLLESLSWSQDISGGVSWTRDADFRIETETVTSGSTISYLYDDDGLPLCVGACSWASGSVTVGGNAMQVFWDDTEHEVETWAGNNPSNSWSTVPLCSQLGSAQRLPGDRNTHLDFRRFRHDDQPAQREPGARRSWSHHEQDGDNAATSTAPRTPSSSATPTTRTVGCGRCGRTRSSRPRTRTPTTATGLNDGSLATDAIYDDQDRLNTYGDNTYSYNDAGQLVPPRRPPTATTRWATYEA